MIIRRSENALLVVVSFLLLSASAWAQGITASSSFNPEVARVGQQVRYQITLKSADSNPSLESLNLPEVDGIRIQYVGPSTRRDRNLTPNGFRQTIEQSYNFAVWATEPGEVTIPSFEVAVGGSKVSIPAATLKAVEAGGSGPGGKQPSIFAELELPRESHYVGEAVVAKLKLYFDNDRVRDVSAGSRRPISVKEGDAFRVGDFGNQQSRAVEKDGRILQEISWEVMITPLKTGPQPLVIQLDLVVAVADEPSSGPTSRFERLLGRSFPSFFDRQQISLYTEDEDLTILPLPTEGKPLDFTGGIGMFTVDQPVLSTSQPMAGEPVTLTLVVRGQGNFGRLEPPPILPSDEWRDYEPESSFKAADDMGYTGVKTFEYTIIPRDPGDYETPGIAFNFFNPDTAKYVELAIPGEEVTVAPNPNAKRPAPVVAKGGASRRGPQLLPIANAPGEWVGAIRPVVTSPLFWGAQLVPALAFGFIIVRRRQQLRLANDAVYARKVRSAKMVAEELEKAQGAAAGRDVARFYEAAQRAVQAAAGRHIDAAPESLTAADVAGIAEKQGLDEAHRRTFVEFFEAGDAIRFGGLNAAEVDFESERRRLEETVNTLSGGTQ